METSSIIMLIFGATLLYGGLGFFIFQAAKAERRKKVNSGNTINNNR